MQSAIDKIKALKIEKYLNLPSTQAVNNTIDKILAILEAPEKENHSIVADIRNKLTPIANILALQKSGLLHAVLSKDWEISGDCLQHIIEQLKVLTPPPFTGIMNVRTIGEMYNRKALENEACEFHDWAAENEWHISNVEQQTFTTSELYKLFKQSKEKKG